MTSQTTHSDKKDFSFWRERERGNIDNNKYLTNTEVNTVKICDIHQHEGKSKVMAT